MIFNISINKVRIFLNYHKQRNKVKKKIAKEFQKSHKKSQKFWKFKKVSGNLVSKKWDRKINLFCLKGMYRLKRKKLLIGKDE